MRTIKTYQKNVDLSNLFCHYENLLVNKIDSTKRDRERNFSLAALSGGFSALITIFGYTPDTIAYKDQLEN